MDGRVRRARRARSDPVEHSISSTFFEGAWDTTTIVDGTSYGVPWYVETRLLYYRTDLAEEGGSHHGACRTRMT